MGLDKWAVAFWLEVNAKNSISSYEVSRALGITQKSAWFMLHRIRLAVKTGNLDKLGGEGSNGVEADETYIGGKAEFMHKEKRKRVVTGTGAFGSGKSAVMGLLERKTAERASRVRAAVIQSTKRETIHDVIRKNVEPGTELYTDAAHGYRGLTPEFIHAFIDHAEKYVDGKVHTNGLENFWSLFKRCIKGTHVSVDPYHLLAYVDSECFRFNHRKLTDGERMILATAGFAGKRLTYKALINTSALEFFAAGNDSGAGSANPVS
jgi:transposase-like protein